MTIHEVCTVTVLQPRVDVVTKPSEDLPLAIVGPIARICW